MTSLAERRIRPLPMPHLTRRHFAQLGLAVVLFPRALSAQERLSIAAVNYPLAYFAERIAGEAGEVIFPVPVGQDPSFWRPGIADIAAFQSADMIVLNGAGFADWTARTSLPRSRLVITSRAFEDAFIATETVTHSHGDGGEHSHTGTASYTWLDFGQAAQQAQAIAAGLSRVAPDMAEAFDANLAALQADLAALGTAAEALSGPAAELPVIASHPRYQYFARAYGLSLEAVDWDVAATPSEAQWAELAAIAEAQGARIFLWEGAPSPEAVARIAALGMVSVTFPPLANRPMEGDFLSHMQASLERLSAAMEGAAGG